MAKRKPALDPEVWLSHPSWYVTPSPFKDDTGGSGGTLQGRITCKKGSHQTDPPPVQDCRRSRFREGIILCRDLSQIELRTAALLSGEPAMIREYNKPDPDLHTAMTKAIYGPSITSHPHFKDGGPKDPRQVGKTANFLILFRGGSAKLQETLLDMTGYEYPFSECESMVDAAKQARPVLWSWQDELLTEASRTGRVTLPFTGQCRWFMGGDKYDVNEIVNFPVQTTAGNTLLRIQHHFQRLVDEEGLSSWVLPFLNVYDALYVDCSSPETAAAADRLLSEATSHVAENDYWGMLQEHTGNTVPLE